MQIHQENSLLPVTMMRIDNDEKIIYYFNPRTCKLYDENQKLIDTSYLKDLIDPKCLIDDKSSKDRLYKPKELRIHLGYFCNRHCGYCIQRDKRDFAFITFPETYLQKFINRLKDNLDLSELESIQFWGGEPLVYVSDIYTIVKYIRKKHIVSDTTIIHLLTNGSLINREFIDFCLAYDLYFSISDDGPDTYRDYSVIKDKKVYNLLKYYLSTVRQNHFSISTTLTDKNIFRLQETEDYFVKYFGEEIRTKINATDIVINKHNEQCTLDIDGVSLAIYKYLLSKTLQSNMLSNYLVSFLVKLCKDTTDIDTSFVRCFLDDSSVTTVDRNGWIYPCQNYCGTKHRLYNLEKELTNNIIVVPNMDNLCLSCPVVSLCGDGCAMSRYIPNSLACKSAKRFYSGILMYGLSLLTQCKLVPLQIG